MLDLFCGMFERQFCSVLHLDGLTTETVHRHLRQLTCRGVSVHHGEVYPWRRASMEVWKAAWLRY